MVAAGANNLTRSHAPAVAALVLAVAACGGGGGGGGDSADGGDTSDNGGGGSDGGAANTSSLAASEYRSDFIIGSTKDDGSPIASNAGDGFNNPADIAVSEDHFFVADSDNNRISKFERSGELVDTWPVVDAESGGDPRGVALGPGGRLYVAQFADNLIAEYRGDGTRETFYGPGGSDSFHRIAIGSDFLYVTDAKDHRILRYEIGENMPNASLGGADSGWQGDTNALEFGAVSGSDAGYFTQPRGVAVDPARGYLYVADTRNNRVQKFDLGSGEVVDVWGEDGSDQPPDFAAPRGIAVDGNGNVYVADITRRVWKFTADGSRIARFGGTGSGPGKLAVPVGIAVDDDGNLYVAEITPNHRVQKFSPVAGSDAAIAGDASGEAGPGALATVPAGDAQDAAIEALRDLGLTNRGADTAFVTASTTAPEATDYVATEVDDNGYRRITMSIGPDGNIIPTGDWRDDNTGFCSASNEKLKGAVRLLNVKVYPVDDSFFAFAQYIDVATGEILEQREGVSSGLSRAINEAVSKLQVTIGSTTSPCETVARDFRFRFETDLVEEITLSPPVPAVITRSHEAVASGSLTYDRSEGQFEGSAPLTWKTHDASTTEPRFSYVACPAPETGRVEIVYRAGPDGRPDGMVDATVDFVNVGQPDCLQQEDALGAPTFDDPLWREFPRYWQKYHSDEYDSATDTFTIEGWEAVPSADGVVAQKYYDFTDTGSNNNGDLVYEETSLIRIKR